jgi:teichuronic acid exporter
MQKQGHVLSGAFSNIRRLLMGNGAAQALQFASIFVLSRLYQPLHFGVLAQIQSIATIVAILLTLQMHLAIPLTQGKTEADQLASQVECICIIGLVLTLGIALLLGDRYLGMAGLLALGVGLNNIYTSVFVSRGQFKILSVIFLFRAIVIVLMQMAFCLVPLENALAWATVLGELTAAFTTRMWRLREVPFNLNGQGAWQAAAKLRQFSLYGSLQELTSAAAFLAPLLLFSTRFGEAVTGHYAMASRLVWAPIVLVSSSIAQVLYHQYGREPPKHFQNLISARLATLAVLSITTTCLAAFLSQDLIILFLGAQWHLASEMLPWHLAWGALFLVSTPFRVACRMLGQQKIQLGIDAVLLVCVILVFVFLDLQPIQFMMILFGVAMLQNATLIWLIHRVMKR